jgi:copper chaperone
MNTQRTTLEVEGMTCHSCVGRVKGALNELDGVCSIDVRMREGKVVVEHEAEQPAVNAMIEALREAGYESTHAPQ